MRLPIVCVLSVACHLPVVNGLVAPRPCEPLMEIPYDGIDQDCDGEDLVDVDGDGYPGVGGLDTLLDCDDGDFYTHPGAEDRWYDGLDQNCDGRDDYDKDGDGFAREDFADFYSGSLPATDCDDADPSVSPDARDEPYDGFDTNCDCSNDFDDDDDSWMIAGLPDAFHTFATLNAERCDFSYAIDGDAERIASYYEAHSGDCDEWDPEIHPGAEEWDNDNVDQNCNGGDNY